MLKYEECKKCEHANNLKVCAEKYVGEVRRLISEGDMDSADL